MAGSHTVLNETAMKKMRFSIQGELIHPSTPNQWVLRAAVSFSAEWQVFRRGGHDPARPCTARD
jgi:hypothetical protein